MAKKEITKKELYLINKLIGICNKKNLYGTEKELFNKLDSVQEVKQIRKKLSKQVKSFKDLEKINKLAD